MKKIYLSALILCFIFATVDAQVVWNGPTITFTKAPGADWTVAQNQDRITENVWITRANNMGIFNIKSESSYTKGGTSPAGTEWATGSLSNYSSLTYRPFEQWHGGQQTTPQLNTDVVVHLISENIYIGLRFLSWGGSGGAGFSYQRTTAAVLPVTFRGFSASVQNNKTVLQWKTLLETDNQYFEIEHSTDGSNFKSVGKLNGSNNSSIERSYTFTHTNISSGKNYYRLAQYDVSGAVKYSQVVLVTAKGVFQLQVKPNPATSFIAVTASSSLEGMPFVVRSASGQIVKKGVLTSQQIDVQQLKTGQYWITVEASGGETLTSVFIKN